MTHISKTLIVAGLLLVLAGLVLNFFHKVPYIGRLPGDILIKRDGFTFYFPFTTCLLISVLIALVMSVLRRR